MVGLVIVTHGPLAQGFLDAANLIVGPQEGVFALPLARDDDPAAVRQRLAACLAAVAADGAIVMTDMFGGTPTNLAQSFLEPERVEVLTGVSLPMVLKFCSSRRQGMPLRQLATLLRDYGRQGVILVSELIEDAEGQGGE